MIDKNKVRAYFDFYKVNNPLYKDLSLNEDLIDQFQSECTEYAEKFEESSNKINEEIMEVDKDEGSNSESESESDNDAFNSFEVFDEFEEDTESAGAEEYLCRDQSTVFCNKYEEDVKVPTVANRLANIIVSVEIINGIDSEIYEADKADINDDIDHEEAAQFLDNLEKNESDLYNLFQQSKAE